MALYSGATQRPIPPGANDPRITAIGAILHTDAGNSKSLFGYFNGPSGGIESHFHIPKVGKPEQYRDTGWEADANFHGNSFILNGKLYGYVSIETQGYATDEWNPYQLAEIKKLLLWLSETHKFPLVKCASATSPGVGYHTMWGAPGPWTPVAKDCPGAKRIKQFGSILVPWFSTAGTTPTPPKDDDVALTPAQEAAIAKAGWLAEQFAQGAQFETDLDGIAQTQAALAPLATKAELAVVSTEMAVVSTKLDELIAAVQALALPKA